MFIYILSQVFIVINYAFLVITYQLRDRKTILLFNVGAQFFTALSYFLLNAYSAVAMAIIALIRDLLFMYTSTNENKKLELFLFIIIIISMIVFGVITFTNCWSILPVAATVLYTISVYQKNIKIFKLSGIIVSQCWIIYNISVLSLFGIILESILLLSSIIGFIRDRKIKEEPEN